MDDNVNLFVFFWWGRSKKGVSPYEMCGDICKSTRVLAATCTVMMAIHRYTYILWHKNVPQSSKSYKSCKLKIYTYLILFQYPGCPIHVSPGCAWITTIEPLGHDFILCFRVAPQKQPSKLPVGTGRAGRARGEWYSFLMQKGFTLLKL